MSDQCVGEIRMFGGTRPPAGWVFCDGSLLPISSYEVLFSLIGTTYGGNGTSNFAVPDMRGRIPVSQGTGQGLSPRPLGQMGGTENVTINVTQMPAHTHSLMAGSSNANSANPSGNVLAVSVNSNGGTNQDFHYLKPGPPAPTPEAMNANAIQLQGGSIPHPNIMGCCGVNFIIATVGVYPSFS